MVQVLSIIRTTANQDSNYYYAFAGDFNLYDGNEPAYNMMLDSMAVDLEDPINRRGEWHDRSSFADVHTQSTRTTQLPDGGASEGLDDRFDFILLSPPPDAARQWTADLCYRHLQRLWQRRRSSQFQY